MPIARRLTFAAPALAGLLLAGAAGAQTPAPVPAGRAERHPRIRAAIRALRGAIEDLEKAGHDFGGHKGEALTACRQAIAQLEQAAKYQG